MSTYQIIFFVCAWCAFHLLALLVRLPFSEKKVSRLASYGAGVGMIAVLVAMGYLCSWLSDIEWIRDTMTPPTAPHGFADCLLGLVVVVGMTLACIVSLSLLVGQMAAFVSSWTAHDFEV